MSVIYQMGGAVKLISQLLYGSGLRVSECLRMRIKDLDFANHQIIVCDGKGENDQATILPDALHDELIFRIEITRLVRQKDLREGFGEVSLPDALEKKYPSASREFAWQYVFP